MDTTITQETINKVTEAIGESNMLEAVLSLLTPELKQEIIKTIMLENGLEGAL
ncbi:hypothetical protein [Listeria booriae]|uniref:hypothetical protein n=1 Tax=Listeria booriae TaxID=1552123 RepID=UPI001625F627|nr:hypothetical protein [Listeria booriae]MBC2392007.1 hypothetical protein [Listeria booriae]